MRARSVQIALPEMSFPSQTDERARARGQVAEDVAERDELRREVRDLDADGLLPGDRSEDPDLRGRERIREVVLEPGDLGHLRARRELELVAGHARARDLPGDASPPRRTRTACGRGDPRSSRSCRSSPRRPPAKRGAACGREAGTRSARTTSRRRTRHSRVRLGLVGERERRSSRVRGRADDVRVRLRPVEQAVLHAAAGATCSRTSTSSAVCDSLDGHSNARRAPEPARFTTWPGATKDRARRRARHEEETRERGARRR